MQRVGTRQAFVSGQLAMVEDGSWALKDILNSAKFRVGDSYFQISYAGGDGNDVVDWTPAQLRWANSHGQTPNKVMRVPQGKTVTMVAATVIDVFAR